MAATHSAPVYELVPSKPLEHFDLARSLGGDLLSFFSRLVPRSDRVVAVGSTGNSVLPEAVDIEKSSHSRAALVAYGIGHVLAAVACVVNVKAGAPIAVVALLLTLPGSLSGVALLRSDVMKLQVRAYEFWFYLLVNTVSAVLLSRGFGDVRACIAVVVWFGNFHTIAVDANTKLVGYLVRASAATVALSMFVLLAMESAFIPDYHTGAIQSQVMNGTPPFNTNNLISNGLVSMMIILCRNVYRRHFELIQAKKINCSMMRCLNLRCRLSMQAADKARLERLSTAQGRRQNYYTGPMYYDTSSSAFPISQLHNVRVPAIFAGSQTLYPVQLTPLQWTLWERLVFTGLGGTGLALTATVFGVYPSPHTQPIALVGLCCTLAFMTTVFGLYHRGVCRGIVLSFDFIFLSVQFSLGLWSAAMLFEWDVRSVALASMWLWLHWVITIDALTPLMKEKIGFNTKLLLVPGLLLFLAAQTSLILEMVWLDHWGIRDRVLMKVAGRFVVTLLPFLVSRVIMSSLWSVRLLWRIINSGDNDVVIILGRLAFLARTLPEEDPHYDYFLAPNAPKPTTTTPTKTLVAPMQTQEKVRAIQ